MKAEPRIGLTGWLALLVLGSVVPLFILAGLTLLEISKSSRAYQDRGQVDTTRALALAVDGEVRSWKTALTALGASGSLRAGRLAEFYEEARQVALQHDGWIVLTDGTGQQLLNTLRPLGTPLPTTSAPETLRAIFEGGQPAVTDLFFGNVAQRFNVAVAVPVLGEGKVQSMLEMGFGPERLVRLLQSQKLPGAWVAAIYDAQRKLVARSREHEAMVGKPMVGWIAAARGAADSGIATGPLIDGRSGQVAFERLREVPWTVVLAVPAAELQSAAPIWGFILVGAVLGLAAIGTAVYVGRKITTPVSRLAEASERMLRGEAVDLGGPSGIREVRELQKALVESSEAAQAHYQERERAAIAEERARVAAASEQALRESAQALRESRELLEAVIEGTTDAIFVKDLTGRYCLFNTAAARFTGKTADEVLGKDDTFLFSPDQAKLIQEGDGTVMADRETRTYEETLVTAQGDRKTYITTKGPLFDEQRNVTGLFGVARDITERKRAEAERETAAGFLRLVNESEGKADLIRAAATFFQEQSGCEAVGIRLKEGDDYPYYEVRGFSEEFVLVESRLCARDEAGQPRRDGDGNPVLECLCGDVIGGRLDPSQPVFTASGSFWTNSITDLLAGTGERVPFAPTRSRCTGEGYESMALIALRVGDERLGLLQLNDRRKGRFSAEAIALWERLAGHLAVAFVKCRVEEALRKAHDELELRVRERTAELSGALQTLGHQSEQLRELATELTLAEQRERRRLAEVLHEGLQQLLVSAKLRVSLLDKGPDPAVREACREIDEFLTEGLAFSRDLTRELSPPILHAAGLTPALEWLAHWMLEKHDLTIDLRMDDNILPDTEAMTALLFQSVRELLFNVVKHARVRRARVEVTRRDDQVEIGVSDTGVGFDPASLRREEHPSGGFGLFSICQRLELLGGRMDIESAPGQGSRLRLLAPLRPPQPPGRAAGMDVPVRAGDAGTVGARDEVAPATDPARKIRVLVVDDHTVVRQALARMLREEPDIEIVGEAPDGRVAVEMARQLLPDVITMDISMPGMDGIKATRAIHAEFPQMRVIGLSMFEESEQARAMREAGAVAYVTKSGAPETLLAAIRDRLAPPHPPPA
ncbi:MAG TPA: response regulator [Candidatus Methylomirabilis sp.]|nr:response regulator [Candidatus Methylomirabilis sp.]